ncbi:Hypothetical predicted protein [Olea europaea subsp. europaea]|uniref:Uncharacterized protein n=1 Tax=Olea europaea subsp. europaea TaxID=158383 RepID=A0A8S0PI69_OLEEU|nr:Hypothetical predicted protein [Olea europaea subsp. europaea]
MAGDIHFLFFAAIFSSLCSVQWAAPLFAIWKYVFAYATSNVDDGYGRRRNFAVEMQELRWDYCIGIWKISYYLWLDLYVTVETKWVTYHYHLYCHHHHDSITIIATAKIFTTRSNQLLTKIWAINSTNSPTTNHHLHRRQKPQQSPPPNTITIPMHNLTTVSTPKSPLPTTTANNTTIVYNHCQGHHHHQSYCTRTGRTQIKKNSTTHYLTIPSTTPSHRRTHHHPSNLPTIKTMQKIKQSCEQQRSQQIVGELFMAHLPRKSSAIANRRRNTANQRNFRPKPSSQAPISSLQ